MSSVVVAGRQQLSKYLCAQGVQPFFLFANNQTLKKLDHLAKQQQSQLDLVQSRIIGFSLRKEQRFLRYTI